MQIWLDIAPGDSLLDNEISNLSKDTIQQLILLPRNDECSDCTKNNISESIDFSLTEEDFRIIRTGIFQQAMPLYCNEFANKRWLVCNPTSRGRVAVLDLEALLLLEQFCAPLTLSQALNTLPGRPSKNVERMAILFCKIGLLQNINTADLGDQGIDSSVLNVWLHVTNACNLRCSYCYLHKTAEHMADDTSRRAVEAIFRSATKQHFKGVNLKYAGGEASLHMANIMTIHDYAARLAQNYDLTLDAVILSNGVALSERTISNLKARNIGVVISLDGIGAYHDSQRPFINGRGSFKYIDRTIDLLLENQVIPHISVTISQRNLSGLSELVEYILEREMPFSLNFYRDNECTTHIHDLQFGDKQMIAAMRSAFDIIARRLPNRNLLGSILDKTNLQNTHNHTCGVGRNYMVIDQFGGVAKCHADITRLTTTIDAADPLEVIRLDRKGVQGLPVEQKEGCKTCEWRHWCTGGCPLLTYRVTGRYDIKSPNCSIYKALFPDVLRLEAMRLLKYVSPILTD